MTSLLRRLRRSTSGVAMTEFALSLPLLLTAGLWGTETANLALTNMQINQLAMHIADNASRIGDTSTLSDRRIYEADINDVFDGAWIQAGSRIDIFDRGRVIVSSLEVDGAGKQYIHWQRCKGDKDFDSTYGEAGDRLPSGMGPSGRTVMALAGDAVIFVEISYTYKPLISDKFVGDLNIHSIASFMVRDDRDLSQIYQRDEAFPDPVATCT